MNFSMPFKLDDEFRQRNRKHTKQERFNLERIIEEEGCADGALTVALIGADKLLIDGYTSLSICQEKGITPTTPRYLPFKDRAEVLEWIDRRQRSRRNLSAEEMAANRAERIERVVESRAQGQSVRTIAEAEGVAIGTVQADIEEATVQGRTVNPPSGKVKGKDGRQQPAEKPLPRCEACKRKGCTRADCGACAQLQLNAKKRKRKSKPPKGEPAGPNTKACPHCKGTGRIEVKPPETPEAALADFPPEFRTEAFLAAWQSWMQHRKEKGETIRPTGRKLQIKFLVGLGVQQAIVTINYTIFKGWTGLVEPTEKDLHKSNGKSIFDPLKAAFAKAEADGSLDREHGT